MLLCLPFAYYYQDGTANIFLKSGITVAFIGICLFLFTKSARGPQLKRREGFIVVIAGWLVMALTGTIPYLLAGVCDNFSDAFFENMSGFTATGATILGNIEATPETVLFWRSLTQWIGGMGMIVLAIAILPILGFGSMRLFSAEAPGISPDKISPRIGDTAKKLWLLYFGLTVILLILLMLGGLSFFDAINHSMTTLATGGFSTKTASVGFFNSAYVETVIMIFMFLGGTSFILIYYLAKLKWTKIWKNEEWRFYTSILFVFGFVCSIGLMQSGAGLGEGIRKGFFQVISLVTTTGYTTADYTSWQPSLTMICFLLMFVGGSAGSTSGGVKIIRHLILFKNSIIELRKQLHSNAVIPVRINGRAIQEDIKSSVLAFIMIYVAIIAVSSIIISFSGIDFTTALGAVCSSLGNVGPAIGDVGPANNYGFLPAWVKYFLSFLMLLGRLELFTIMILFTPFYWIKR